MVTPVEMALAFWLDLAIGDPRAIPHPVQLIGKAIEGSEKRLRQWFGARTGGMVLTVWIVSFSTFAAYIVMRVLKAPDEGVLSFIGTAVYVYMISTTLALKGLVESVRKIVSESDVQEARKKLSMIVGRDTDQLDEEAVRRAAVESLAENTSDGVVAPLLYLAIGGLPLAMAYKAVNTLDSMVGYKNEKYRDFGYYSAKLDDVLNYIPARITGLMIVVATYLISGFDMKRAVRSFSVMRRDGRNHTSPNSGVPEAAMAGALNARFGGPSTYGGVVFEKPYIFTEGGGVSVMSARQAIVITVASSLMCLLLAMGVASFRGLL
jgi:adenosylcobinamide-phosphate synthase